MDEPYKGHQQQDERKSEGRMILIKIRPESRPYMT